MILNLNILNVNNMVILVLISLELPFSSDLIECGRILMAKIGLFCIYEFVVIDWFNIECGR